MFDNLSFNPGVKTLSLIALFFCFMAIIYAIRARRITINYEGKAPEYLAVKRSAKVFFVITFAVLLFAWPVARYSSNENHERPTKQQQLTQLQADLSLNDWSRDNAKFLNPELSHGRVIVRDQGCRIQAEFMARSDGQYVIIVGSGELSGAHEIWIKPVEKDGGYFQHSREECEEIARKWDG